ncbi:MAG: DUF433 domain-containing protein [Anaerolineae bacterium]|nr:DUF433 domain-containing protein [Anaerolineae bacterium]
MSKIQISQQMYDKVAEVAAQRNQTPDQFVENLLATQLLPPHPYVEVIQSRSQPRAVIKGTRVGVDVIIGYMQAGYSPQAIAANILPQLSLAQIYDALSYYEDHRIEIEAVLSSNKPENWQEYIKHKLGKEASAQLLGQQDVKS